MADEDIPNDGTLFGPDFGKKAKERVDAIKSLASSSFFDSATLQQNEATRGRRVAEEAPGDTNHTPRKEGATPSGASLVNRPDQLPRSDSSQETTKTDIQSAKRLPPPLIYFDPSSGDSDDETPSPPSSGVDSRRQIQHHEGSRNNHCRTLKILPQQLGETLRQQVDSRHCCRIQDPTKKPLPLSLHPPSRWLTLVTQPAGEELSKLLSKECLVPADPNVPGFLLSHLHHTEEERRTTVNHQFEEPEPVRTSRPFQDGEYTATPGYSPPHGLDGENRFEGGILLSPHPPSISGASTGVVE